jgi:hypothetical protein
LTDEVIQLSKTSIEICFHMLICGATLNLHTSSQHQIIH